jgi:trimeric autotransporter adhesin
MAVKFSNNAATLLAANATTSDTTLTVSDGSVFPTLSGSDHTYVTLEDVNANREIVKLTAISGNTLTVVRAQDGTTARAFSTSDKCELRVTAALLNDLNTDADTESVSKSGDTMTGNLNLGDNVKAQFGASDDLQIYHDGSMSYIDDAGNGDLRIRASNDISFRNYANEATAMNLSLNNGSELVQLYYAGSLRLATSATGIDVNGTVTADGLTVDGTTATIQDDSANLRFENSAGTRTGYIQNRADAFEIWDDQATPMTFGTSNAERMRIDSAGTLFQGTTSPTLHSSVTGIVFTNGSLLTESARGADKSLTLAQNVAIDAGNTWAYLSTDEASYYQQYGGNHYFATAASGTAGADATLATKMIILNNGNAGIGTSTPASPTGFGTGGILHLKGSTGNDCSIVLEGLSGSGGRQEIGASGGALQFYRGAATGSMTESMRINSSGKVGIGVSASLQGQLNVGEAASGDPSMYVFGSRGAADNLPAGHLTFRNVANGVGDVNLSRIQSLTGTGSNQTQKGQLAFSTNDGSSLTERMRIDSSGNVKIGDSSTDITSKLTVSGNASSDVATFMYDGSAGTYFDIDCNAAGGSVNLKADARTGAYPPLLFTTGNAERLRIDSSGNLLVGNTAVNPASNYSTIKGFGYAAATGKVEIATTADDAVMEIGKNNANDGSLMVFRKQGTVVGSIGVTGGDLYIENGITGISFNNAHNALIPTTTGGVVDDANQDLGISSHRFRNLYLSGTAYVDTAVEIHAGNSLKMQNVAGNGFATIQNAGAGTNTDLSFNTAGSERMRIDSSGRVGIGSSTGASAYGTKLFVEDSSAGLAIFHRTGSGGLTISADNDGPILGSLDNADSLRIFTGSAERLRIDSSGNVILAAGTGTLQTATAGTSNLRLGVNAGNSIIAGGDYNTVVGDEAGTALTTGDQNVAIGFEALSTATTASRNTAVGLQALRVNTGDDNSAFGYGALISNTTGTYNTAIGRSAGFSVTTGTNNTLIGGLAGDATTTGSNNVAVGKDSLGANTTGSNLVGVGQGALAGNTTGNDNVAVGRLALDANTTGGGNVALGSAALGTSTTGTNNTALGYSSLTANTTASNNTAVGANALTANTTGADNTAVGTNALNANTTGYNLTALGYQAMYSSTTGYRNTGVGYQAGYSITDGTGQVAMGDRALYSATGNFNTGIGNLALFANTTASNNTAVGYAALTANTTGAGGTAVGISALSANTTGTENVGLGGWTLAVNTTGTYNTAVGTNALDANTTADNNTAVGYNSLTANTTASNNTAVGKSALAANTTASNNTAVGYSALTANTTGASNTAVGFNAVAANTTGIQNTSIGGYALASNTTAQGNTALGFGTLYTNTTGASNTAVGLNALNLSTTASNNTAVGASALYANTTGAANVAIGVGSLGANTTANNNTAVGTSSLVANTTGTSNVALGTNALGANTTASNNTGLGFRALFVNTTGASNTAVGSSALVANTTGTNNVAVGHQAGASNLIGADNTYVGFGSGYSGTSYYNTAVGKYSLYNSTGAYNVAMGTGALQANTTASNNTAVGYSALAANTTGTGVTAVGYAALVANTTGNYNVAFGNVALTANTTASNNTAMGLSALEQNTTASNGTAMGFRALKLNTTGANNTALGFESLYANTTAANNTAVGYAALTANTTGASNVAVGYQALTTNTTGQLLTAVGHQALTANSGDTYSTALGARTLQSNTTGFENVAVGDLSSNANTTGGYNVSVGNRSLLSNTTASNNTAVGHSALGANTTGTGNSALGKGSLGANTTASYNTGLGENALLTNTTGASNTAVGNSALYANTTASNNTAVGTSALTANTTGASNVAVGYQAGYSNTTGTSNLFVGMFAGNLNTTGSYNTYVGRGNGYGAGDAMTTGSANVILGAFSGNNAGLDIRTASNHIVLSDGDGNPRGIFDSSGNLLVGGTNNNPAGANVAGHAIGASGYISTTRDGGFAAFLNRKTSDGEIVRFGKDGATVGSIGTSAETMYVSSAQAGGMKFTYLNSTNALMIPVTTAGANADATHDLGYSSSRFRDLYLSGGVYLGGTGAANKLDDFETGTWTPALQRVGAGNSLTYTSQTGYYTKVGRKVSVNGRIVINAVTSQGSSVSYISGLPFSIGGLASITFAGSVGTNTGLATVVVSVCMARGTETSITFRDHANTTANLDANYVAGGIIVFSLEYFID